MGKGLMETGLGPLLVLDMNGSVSKASTLPTGGGVWCPAPMSPAADMPGDDKLSDKERSNWNGECCSD